MGARRGGLGDAKGGGLLADLMAKLKPAPKPAPKPTSTPVSQEPELQDAFLGKASVPPPEAGKTLAEAMRHRARPKKQGIPSRPVRAKPKKERIKIPAAAREAVLASFRTPIAPPTKPAAPAYDFGEGAFRRIARLRDRLDGFVASHGAPALVSGGTAVEVGRRIAAGTQIAADPDDGFFVGVDFGTSSTKAVLRHPYRRVAFAAPVPEDLATDHQPHLWPTVVFLDPSSGGFSLCPAADRIALTGFKSALIERRGHRTCGGSNVTMAEAATAFLTLYLAQLAGILAMEEPGAGIAGLHIAIPVASLASDPTKAGFDRVVRTALNLLPEASALTIDHIRAAASSEGQPVITHELHAELAGAIAGYCTQPRRYAGAHMIVDCGSATLDIASFHLSGDLRPAGIHAARVERLGADACALYQREGASARECRDASRFQEHTVFCEALRRDFGGFGQAEGNFFPYQMILVGGGMANEIHSELFNGMETSFQRAFQRPEIARDLICAPGTDPSRLIVADGLARDPIELREVAMPGDRPSLAKSVLPEMITKDHM